MVLPIFAPQRLVAVSAFAHVADVNPLAAVRPRFPDDLVVIEMLHHPITHRLQWHFLVLDIDVGCLACLMLRRGDTIHDLVQPRASVAATDIDRHSEMLAYGFQYVLAKCLNIRAQSLGHRVVDAQSLCSVTAFELPE